MKIQKVTKKVSEKLKSDGVGGINVGQIMTVLIATEECGFITSIGSVKEAMDVIKLAMVEDDPGQPGSYAHSWHCNIAMMCHDAIHSAGLVEGGPLSDDAPSLIGNDAASRFMKLCFDVKTKQ